MSTRSDDFPKVGGKPLSTKRRLLRQGQRLLYRSGLAESYARFTQAEGALILMYHSVPGPDVAPYIDPANAVPVEQFDEHLRYLKRYCNVISLGELRDALERKQTLPRRTVLITFDDGYRDNFSYAAPLLKQYQLPAAIFLCTGYVERGQPQWIDELYCHFNYRTRHRIEVDGQPFDLMDPNAAAAAYRLVASKLSELGLDARTQLLAEVQSALAPTVEMPRLTMSWDEVRELNKDYPNITLGLHTRDHLNLPTLSTEVVQAELERCQRDFQTQIGRSTEYFCYPYGLWTESVRAQVQALDWALSLATYPSLPIQGSFDRYALPRLEVSDSLVDIKAWTTGAFPNLSLRVFGRVYD